MARVVEGLISAQAEDKGPWPKGRSPRGAKAQGLRFEALVHRGVPSSTRGQWWHFCDANGPGWCQTDVLLIGSTFALVLECKLTWTPEAGKQLGRLYKPVVEKALSRPMVGVTVIRGLGEQWREALRLGETLVEDLPSAISLAKAGGRPVLPWRGATGLLPGIKG